MGSVPPRDGTKLARYKLSEAIAGRVQSVTLSEWH
jgi:hypothetical protein